MDEEKNKRLKVMRFWLFGTFIIVLVSITVYIGLYNGAKWLAALKVGFPIWGIVAAACVIWYGGYLWWLRRE